jgi:hypothetical protein
MVDGPGTLGSGGRRFSASFRFRDQVFEPRFRLRVEEEILVEVASRFGLPTIEEVHQPPPRKRREIARISP